MERRILEGVQGKPEARTHVPLLRGKDWQGGGGAVPDIFQVAVGGLSGLLLSRQAQLFGELPESCSVKDPCLTRRHRGNRQSGNNRLTALNTVTKL